MLRTVSQGLEAPLDHYHKLTLEGTGVDFLDVQCQQVLLADGMSRFLAHSQLETDRNAQRFDLMVNGKEVLSASRKLQNKQDIPLTEVNALEAVVKELLAKGKDPELSQRGQQVITQFRLPDPDREPEMYRLYGWPWDRRLGVLWGCEGVRGSGLPPLEAIERLRRRGISAGAILAQRLAWLVGALLILGLVGWLGMWAAGGWSSGSGKPIANSDGKVVPPEGIRRQFLQVKIEPTSGTLPKQIIASASEPGRIVFSHAQRILSDKNLPANEPSSITVDKPGDFRVLWHPDDTNKFNGEFINLKVDETQVIESVDPMPKPSDPPKPITDDPPKPGDPPMSKTGDPAIQPKPEVVEGSGDLQVMMVHKQPLRLRVSKKYMPDAELTAIEWSIGPNPAKIIRGQQEIEINLQSGVTPINVTAKHGDQKLVGSASLKVEINLTK